MNKIFALALLVSSFAYAAQKEQQPKKNLGTALAQVDLVKGSMHLGANAIYTQALGGNGQSSDAEQKISNEYQQLLAILNSEQIKKSLEINRQWPAVNRGVDNALFHLTKYRFDVKDCVYLKKVMVAAKLALDDVQLRTQIEINQKQAELDQAKSPMIYKSDSGTESHEDKE